MGSLAGAVFLDASAIIYLLEGNAAVQSAARRVLAGLRSGTEEPPLAVSVLSRLECRVQPLRAGDMVVLERYHEFFADPGLLLVPLSLPVVDRATELRARHNLQTPDALQAACALELGERVRFVTADRDLEPIEHLDVHRIAAP